MPRRAPSPPPLSDSLFFTVVNPYPDQPHQSYEDSKIFSRWIACIVGADRLHAFYHKPKSANVVIVEVSPDVDPRRLLGAHRWAEILREPHPEDKDEVSSIFRCTKTSDSALYKDNWVRHDVEESWFRKWSPASDEAIAHPYPSSQFCLPPPEDRMRLPLCLPIPTDLFRQQKPADSVPSPPRVSQGYRSTPSSSSASPELSDLSADELLVPTSMRPGANPIASGHLQQYILTIRGADTPQGDAVGAASAEPADGALWSGYGDSESSDPAQAKLCGVHGILCHGGICKLRGQEKHAALLEKRAKERDEARLAREAQRQRKSTTKSTHRTTKTPPKGSSSGESASGESASEDDLRAKELKAREDRASRLRPDIKAQLAKGKGKHAGVGASYASAAKTTNAPRTLPPHLRRSGFDATTKSDSSESEDSVGHLGSRPMHIKPPAPQPAARTVTPGAGRASSQPLIPVSIRSSSKPRPASSASRDSSASSSSSSSSSPSLPSPLSPPPAWHAYVKVPGLRADDERSVVTDATNDAFANPWKHVRPMQAVPPRWVDVDGVAQPTVETSASAAPGCGDAYARAQCDLNHQDYEDEDEEDEFALGCVGPVEVCDIDGEDDVGGEDTMSNVSDYTDEPF